MDKIEYLNRKMNGERNRNKPNFEKRNKVSRLSDSDCACYYVYGEIVMGIRTHGYYKQRLIDFMEQLKNQTNNHKPYELVEDVNRYYQMIPGVIDEIIENTKNNKIGFESVEFL